ncbi:MAG: pentapeptide repeat-containing protein [Phycisphaerales bacterium]|jgi:uncharacterized protein YjbI with pentapeptide repeats
MDWLDKGPIPPLPGRPPGHDDETLGVNFFRTRVEGLKVRGLTLPRTFFGRYEVSNCVFADCDLNESTVCWNSWESVDFSASNLSRSDLRGSIFFRVSFADANLRDCDLRHSQFKSCNFSGTDLFGSTVCRKQEKQLLSAGASLRGIRWTDDEGVPPPGG